MPEHPDERNGIAAITSRPLWLNHLAAALVYAAATAGYCYRIALNATSAAPFLIGDGFALLWDYWWAFKSVTTLHSPFRTNLLTYPHQVSLVFHPLDLFDGILTIPIQYLLPSTPGLLLSLNVVVVVCFFLSAFVMYLALWHLTRSWLAAVIGGFAYSFSAFHFTRPDNAILAAMYWLPLFTLLYLRAAQRPSRGRTILAGLCFGLCTFQSLYYTLFLAILSVFLFVFASINIPDRVRLLRRLLALTLVVALFGVPMLVLAASDLSHNEYLAEGATEIGQKPLDDDIRNSIDLAGLVIPGPQQGLWRRYAEPWNVYLQHPTARLQFFGENGEGGRVAYVGAVPLLFCLAAVFCGPRRLVGPWAICALIFLGLALGPDLHLHGAIYSSWPPMPYRLLLCLPARLTRMLRAPHYFFAPALFALWVVAAFGVRALWGTCHARRSVWLTLLGLLLWLVVDYAMPPLAVWGMYLPSIYTKIAADPRPVPVFHVPVFNFRAMEYYAFAQTVHGKPLVRGFVSRRTERTAQRDRLLLQAHYTVHQLSALLNEIGPCYIVLHKWQLQTPADQTLAHLLGAWPELTKVSEDANVAAYSWHLPPLSAEAQSSPDAQK